MKRTIVVGMALLTLVGFGCQSAEERQAQELRQALRQIVDEIEELGEEEIELLRQRKEVVDATPSFKTQWGYETMDRARETAKSALEAAEQRLPEMLGELRREVEEYTDAELPMLAMPVRGRKSGAERAVETAKKGLAQAEGEKKAAEDRAAKESDPAAYRRELAKQIDEVDQIHQKVISTLQAVLNALPPETGQWQRSRARGAVTTAKTSRHQVAGILQREIANAKDGHLAITEGTIASRKRLAETQLVQAQRKLAALK